MHAIYGAYGLTIHSAIALPELPPAAGGAADVVIRFGSVAPPAQTGPAVFDLGPDQAHCYWDPIGSVLVRGGCEVIVDPKPGVDEGLLRLILIGTVMGLVLRQRGTLALHGSAVRLDDGAVIFIGPKKYGKSTTAAAFLRHGHELITDDIAAIRMAGDGRALLLPGARQLKLWSDALAGTVGDSEPRERLAVGLNKWGVRLAEPQTNGALPVRMLCLLDWGPEASLEPLGHQEALLALVANTYLASLGKRPLRGADGGRNFEQCAALQRGTAIVRLRRPPSFERLAEVVEAVRAGVAARGPTGSLVEDLV